MAALASSGRKVIQLSGLIGVLHFYYYRLLANLSCTFEEVRKHPLLL